MPIYEYKCQECTNKFELLRSFGRADDAAQCPRCQSDNARRLVSMFASFSKGDGGVMTAVGGSSCSSCAATSCATCGGGR
jgi:putative FmdB family regulatory protein